jgi:hypothetical protein
MATVIENFYVLICVSMFVGGFIGFVLDNTIPGKDATTLGMTTFSKMILKLKGLFVRLSV